MAYVFGAILPYHVVPLASLPFAVVFLYGFWNVPETPLFLLKNRKFEVRQTFAVSTVRFSCSLCRKLRNHCDTTEAVTATKAMN